MGRHLGDQTRRLRDNRGITGVMPLALYGRSSFSHDTALSDANATEFGPVFAFGALHCGVQQDDVKLGG